VNLESLLSETAECKCKIPLSLGDCATLALAKKPWVNTTIPKNGEGFEDSGREDKRVARPRVKVRVRGVGGGSASLTRQLLFNTSGCPLLG
jgi:hypothetical protein